MEARPAVAEGNWNDFFISAETDYKEKLRELEKENYEKSRNKG